SEKEKTKTMSDFASGKIKILISTTVVEVGVDVPEATNVAIYNADRYGLSQLHQLRGRVGRGEKHGYCFLLAQNVSEAAIDRLRYVEKCSDGFALAEYDFAGRGAGDFLGLSQHGKADIPVSADDLAIAKKISAEVLKNDSIKAEIAATIHDNRFEYYKKITLN
ncbi:MAG: helicase-related protein, partial [Candidatus Neoclostridium sp.]